LWDDSGVQIPVTTPVVTTLADTNAAGTIEMPLDTPELINGSKTYVLKATLTGSASAAGDNMATSLGSSGLGFVASTAAGSVGATATLVWSDRSDPAHTTSTNDWSNDYLVKFLPLDSWSLSK
jgi:hypothetical protein